MAKIWKKLLATILAFSMVMGMLSVTSLAVEEGTEAQPAGQEELLTGSNWTLARNDSDDTFTVIYTGSGELTETIVQDVLTAAGEGERTISGFVVSDTVTSIGVQAFLKCVALKEIRLGNGVMSIGACAFDSCTGLESVNIPQSVTAIGYEAFKNCRNLSMELVLPEGLIELGHSAFKDCVKLQGVVTIPAGLEKVSDHAFENCESLTGMTFAEGAQCSSIGFCAFYGCKGLAGTVSIPESVTELQTSAFANCGSLEKVELSQGVTVIGQGAFGNCSSLQTVSIPDTILTIDRVAFSGCTALTEIELPESLTTLGDNAFEKAGLASIVIPADIQKLGYATFKDCKALSSVTFAEGSQCATIDTWVFAGCDSLKTITLPESVKVVSHCAFRECKGLEEVYMEGDVTTLGDGVFMDCSSLKTVNIPETVTAIGNKAFMNCAQLNMLTIPEGVTVIGENVFPENMLLVGSAALLDVIGGENKAKAAEIYVTGDVDSEVSPIKDCKVFLLNGGTVTEEGAEAPAKEGATFMGWYETPDFSGDKVAHEGTEAGKAYYARWCAEHQWDNGVVTTEPTYETEGVRTYTCSICGETRTETVPVLTRPYTPPTTYTLSYNANGGENAPAAETQTGNRNFTVSAEIPTQEGYSFAGWALSADAETAAYQPGSQLRINSGYNLTLFAVWTAVEPAPSETPEPTPSESVEPSEAPTPTETPNEEDLNNPDTPMTELPEETEPPVEPTETPEPDESEELGESDTPLADVPQTGDALWVWLTLAFLSAAGLVWVSLSEKKGKRVA